MRSHTMAEYERAMIALRDAQRDVERAASENVIAESEGRRGNDDVLDRAMSSRESAIAAICALMSDE